MLRVSLCLFRPKTAFVEITPLSGFTDSGIYVLDHDNTKSMAGSPISLLVRVLETHECQEIQNGKVYVVQNPYNYAEVGYEGETKYVMAESNFLSEVAGYDEAKEQAGCYLPCTTS